MPASALFRREFTYRRAEGGRAAIKTARDHRCRLLLPLTRLLRWLAQPIGTEGPDTVASSAPGAIQAHLCQVRCLPVEDLNQRADAHPQADERGQRLFVPLHGVGDSALQPLQRAFAGGWCFAIPHGGDLRLRQLRQANLETGLHLVSQPGGFRFACVCREKGIGGSQRASTGQHGWVYFVQRVSRGVVKLVRPLDEQGHWHTDGGIGKNVMIGAAGEADRGVAEEGIATQTGVRRCIVEQLFAQPLQQVRGEGAHGFGRTLNEEGRASLGLILAHHIQVDPSHHAWDVVLVARQVGIGAADFGHPEKADAPPGLGQIAIGDKPLQRASRFQGRRRAGGVVVGRGLRVAKVRHDDHLFVHFAGDESGDDFHHAVVEATVHASAHLDRRLTLLGPLANQPAQPPSLARREDKAKAFLLARLARPPEGGVLPGVG